MRFHVISSKSRFPTVGTNEIYLRIDNWNDYSFVTSFDVLAFDQQGGGIEEPLIDVLGG